MRNVWLVLGIGYLLGGCYATASPPPPSATVDEPKKQVAYLTARKLTDSEKKIVREGITRNFKDPDSAQIRWTLFRPTEDKNGAPSYCATVNAKNSYGAYTGYKPFLASIILREGKITTALLITAPSRHSQDIQDQAALDVCKMNGLDPFADS